MCRIRRKDGMGRIGNHFGFTLIELVLVGCMIAVLSGLAAPGILGWVAGYRLRAAASDLYHQLHLAKLTAIRQGQKCRVRYIQPPDGYHIDCLGRSVSLADYGSGIRFEVPSNGSTGSAPNSIDGATITFNSRGTCTSRYVYLTHTGKSVFYQVGPLSTGVIYKRRLDRMP